MSCILMTLEMLNTSAEDDIRCYSWVYLPTTSKVWMNGITISTTVMSPGYEMVLIFSGLKLIIHDLMCCIIRLGRFVLILWEMIHIRPLWSLLTWSIDPPLDIAHLVKILNFTIYWICNKLTWSWLYHAMNQIFYNGSDGLLS